MSFVVQLSGIPLIGVTTWPEVAEGRAPRFSVSRSYFEAIAEAGGAPLGIAPLHEKSLRALYGVVDGLLLTGGGDVDPAHYGEQPIPELGRIDAERDSAELLLARWAMEDNKPVLAICRGEQVLNVACGGTLYQDLPAQQPSELNHNESAEKGIRGLATHELLVEPRSRLAHAIGSGDHRANSHHHQAVKDIGRGLTVTARSEDGIVEAVEHEELSWVVGVQCHPEEMWREHDWARRLFQSFVREVAFGSQPVEPRVIGALTNRAS